LRVTYKWARLTLTLTHTVTEIRSHCSEGGKGWGLSSSLFSSKKNVHFRETWTPKKSWFFDANYLSDSIAIPKKNLRLRAKFFRITHSHSHSHSHSLILFRTENDPFPDSHSLRIKGNDHRWYWPDRLNARVNPPGCFSILMFLTPLAEVTP